MLATALPGPGNIPGPSQEATVNSSAGERIAGSEKQPVHCTKRIGHFTQHSSMIGHQFFSANQVGTGVYRCEQTCFPYIASVAGACYQ